VRLKNIEPLEPMSITPKAIQDLLDELEAVKAKPLASLECFATTPLGSFLGWKRRDSASGHSNAPTEFALQVRLSTFLERRYIPRSPPAVNLTCFSRAICACAWWCRAVAFTIVLRLFIFHNGRDDTTSFLPRHPISGMPVKYLAQYTVVSE